MTTTVTMTINTDDSTVLLRVSQALAGQTPTTGGTSGGTSTGSTFTESVNGTVAICPTTDGQKSGTIYDQFGDTFNLIYSQAAEYGYWQLNGVTMGNADELYYINHQVWVQDHATNWTGYWASGALVQAPLPSPIPNGPVLQNPAPPPPPPGSVTTGGTPVTPTQTGMAAAIKAAAAGSVVTLNAGTYVETSAIPVAITLKGAGIGQTIVNDTGITPNQQKAILVPSVTGITISQMTLTGSAIADGSGGNAAGVRDSADGVGFTLDTVEIYGCQMGCLTFASPIIIKNSHIHDNGNATAGAGTHNVYVGAGPSFDLENSVIEHCSHEHEVKSRSKSTTINGCTLGPTGGNGKCLDVPDGGVVTVTGTTFILGKASANQDLGFMDYATESLNNGIGPITLNQCVFDSTALPGQAGLIIVGSFAPNATIVLNGCTYKGDLPPSFQGIPAGNVTGTITKAA